MRAPSALPRPLLAASAALLLGACGSNRMRTNGVFWRTALGDPTLRVRPEAAPGAPDLVVRRELRGVVTVHQRVGGTAADHRLVVRRDDGESVRLYYRIGQGRRIPVTVGERVVIVLLTRRHLDDEGVDRGLLVRRLIATATADPGSQATLGAREELVAVVQVREIIARTELPRPLRVLRPTDKTAYHEAGTFGDQCQEIRTHRRFRVVRGSWIVRPPESAPPPRDLAPGGAVTLDDGRQRFEVLLFDNRHTEVDLATQWCEQPVDTWSWAAVRVPRPAAPVGNGRAEEPTTVPQGEPGRVSSR